MRKYLYAALFLPLLLMTACVEKEYETAESGPDIGEEMQGVQTEIQADLRTIGEELDAFEGDLEEAGEETVQTTESTVAALRDEYNQLEADIDRLGDAGEGAYDDSREAYTDRLKQLHTDVVAARLKSIESREQFQQVAHEKLQELDAALTELDQRMEEGTSEEVTGEETTASELHEQRREVGERIEDLESATDQAFQERKDDIALAVARLAASVQAAGSTDSYQTAARPAPLSAPVES